MQPSTAWLRYAHTLLWRANAAVPITQPLHLVDRVTLPSRQFVLYNRQHQRQHRYQHQARGPGADAVSMAAEATMLEPKFAAGVDESSLSRKLLPLLASATTPAGRGVGRWTLTPSGKGLERSFNFKTFARTWVSGVLSRLSYLSLLTFIRPLRRSAPFYYAQSHPTCHGIRMIQIRGISSRIRPACTMVTSWNTGRRGIGRYLGMRLYATVSLASP
jgi:hypothetical protein